MDHKTIPKEIKIKIDNKIKYPKNQNLKLTKQYPNNSKSKIDKRKYPTRSKSQTHNKTIPEHKQYELNII